MTKKKREEGKAGANGHDSKSSPIVQSRFWEPVRAAKPFLEEALAKALGQGPALLPSNQPTVTVNVEEFESVLNELAQSGWTAEMAARVLQCFFESPWAKLESLHLWIRSHAPDDAEALCDCIRIVPPKDVRILRRLPSKGSQKIVFEASWGLYQKTVILKKLIAGDLQRELQSHPLTNEHRNIVKTYTVSNDKETFLVEEKLEVLNDSWRSQGTEETALFLHDIGSALGFLRDRGWVHGDIKPDNVGIDRDRRFILLDFGVCRRADAAAACRSATGSLRTRSPELLLATGHQTWMSDLWALGATVCSIAGGRFPLVEPEEEIPRISEPEQRSNFEKMLAARARDEYEGRIGTALGMISDLRIRTVVEVLLAKNPDERGEPGDIIKKLRADLPYAVPDSDEPGSWVMTPEEEAKSILAMWPTPDALNGVPQPRQGDLRRRMKELAERFVDDTYLRQRLGSMANSHH